MKDIIVSVIVPLYNEEKYIRKFLSSLGSQTFPVEKMEWLLIDGMSTDKTVSIIEEFSDCYPIKILINKEIKTPYALNLGIEHAKGKYVIRLDAHAEFSETYIEKCVYYLEHTDADNVGGCAITKAEGLVGEAIAQMLSSRFGVGNSSFRVDTHDGYVDTVPFGAFRREIFEKVGVFDTSLLRSEDNEFNARIRKNGGKIWLSSDIVFTYYCRNTVKDILRMGVLNGNALFRTLRVDRHAMSIRHFIPFIFWVSLVILPCLSIFFPIIKSLFLMECLAYLLLDIIYSFLKGKFMYGVILFWLYPLFHISYGTGSFLGLIGVNLY